MSKPKKTAEEKAARNAKWESGMNKAVAGVNAVGDIAGTAMELSKIDASKAEEKVDEIADLKQNDIDSFDALNEAYQQLGGIDTHISAKDVRNLSTGQAIGGTLKSTMSGATAGLSIGGPWGAVAGAAVGLGGALAGIFGGNAKARNMARKLTYEATENKRNLRTNLNTANDRLMNQAFRAGVANRAAYGGMIERPLERFTRRMAVNASGNDVTRASGLVR